jgi:hypothetical protein
LDGRGKRDQYLSAKPFPHIVLDDLLDGRGLFPPNNAPFWKTTENRFTRNKSVTKAKGHKWELFDEKQKRFFSELASGPFIKFLEDLTGIEGLVFDPHFVEGGFHRVGNGGYLGIHADFSHHPHLGLERRVNLLLYLNESWDDSWGGHLKLYDQELNPVVSVSPVMNRCIIFSTSDVSYHGHPEPMNLPKDAYRKSLALYYYALPRVERDKKRIVFPQDPKFDPARV